MGTTTKSAKRPSTLEEARRELQQSAERQVRAFANLAGARMDQIEARLAALETKPGERPLTKRLTDAKVSALALLQTAEWKQLVDEQYAALVDHIEKDVLPKVVLRVLMSTTSSTSPPPD